MKLSIIIVNYNVEHFIEQCLLSVQKAIEGIDAEVIVVDNASVDGSVAMMRSKFDWIHLIANTDNRGFSKANNQGIEMSKGQYILLLNPDTVVEEDTFKTCITFMDEHPDAGGLGIRMLDGKGNFLPESKRGLPTPAVAFYKIFGLSRLFPKSKRFGRYHLGYLDEFETHEVEILSGAYMFMRKQALDKVGLLDEEYFMYGEDIDLSYRLIKGGYKNYYHPGARIIHYKGESTKKTSVNYVMVFYNAMRIFARKHFSSRHAKSFNKLIELAIYARAGLSILKRGFYQLIRPLADLLLICLGLWFAASLYGQYAEIDFPKAFYRYVLPSYALIWVLTTFLCSAYEFPLRIRRKFQGALIGTGLILILYSLLPEELRFSRAVILIGAVVALIAMWLSNAVASAIIAGAKENVGERNYLLIGAAEEQSRIEMMMRDMGIEQASIFRPNEAMDNLNLETIRSMTEVYNIREVIFCAKDISAERIIDLMSKLDSSRLDFKIAPPESLFIIGSNSKDNAGDFLTYEVNAIAKPINRRNKRILDVMSSIVLLCTAPLVMLVQKRPIGFLSNVIRVIIARATWVGYYDQEADEQGLPSLKPSILQSEMKAELSPEQRRRSNLIYAKDYKVGADLDVILENWRLLGS